MILETNVDYEVLKAGFKELDSQLKSNINKTILIEIFNKYLADNSGYYELRDFIIPDLIGVNASKALFWAIFSGFLDNNFQLIDSYLENNQISFIRSLVFLYVERIMEIKKYNENPMGYNKLHITYTSENIRNNLYIKRNDGNEITFNVDLKDTIKITRDLIYYYNQIQRLNKYTIDQESLNNIKEIKDMINEIESVGCGKNE